VRIIPVTVTARDEERAIGDCLDSLARAIAVAERGDVRCELAVVLDECRDRTAAIVARRGVPAIESRGGKVEAQRTAVRVRPADVHIFCDADVVVAPETIAALCAAMRDPAVHVAVPDKRPLPPRRRSVLARALHVYNARRGFSSQRTWFSGKLFAIRAWAVPEAAELARRAAALPASPFHAFGEPLRVDDIYLSRAVRHAHGPAAIRETTGVVWFRAPETLGGMYRYYRRMRRELARIDALFPESRAPRLDARSTDTLAAAPVGERALHGVFAAALAA
jgi:cellulose synthase/poly-beta-1,6-N-acetylglucosamine synthase-like glycosyltransferase